MFKSPFGLYCVIIVFASLRIIKCAIGSVKRQNGFCDLGQRHFRDIAGGVSQRVQCVLRIEVDDILEILVTVIQGSIHPEARHQHIGDAVGNEVIIHIPRRIFGQSV